MTCAQNPHTIACRPGFLSEIAPHVLFSSLPLHLFNLLVKSCLFYAKFSHMSSGETENTQTKNSQSYHPPHLFCPGTFLLLQCKQALYYIFFLKLVVIFQDIVIAQKLSVIVRKILRSIPVPLLITHCTNTNNRQLFLQFHKELVVAWHFKTSQLKHIASQIISTEIFLYCLRWIICPDHIGSCIGLLAFNKSQALPVAA